MSSSFSDQKSKEFLDAVDDGDFSLVKTLAADAEVNLNWKFADRRNEHGWTPASLACGNGHVNILRFLLDFHGNERRTIDFNLADDGGFTPLFSACVNGHSKVVEMLVEDERIDVNKPDNGNRTPLWWASYCGHVGIVKVMLASARQIIVKKEDAEEARREAKTVKESWETEEDFESRKKGCEESALLIDSYLLDPQAVKERLRRELGYHERTAGELFALVVFLSDGYLRISEKPEESSREIKRFFKLATELPLDLQMVLCNRVYGSGHSIIKRIHSERGFRRFAKTND